ncbi:hypothetical protein SS05631_c22800 [Sinorhizobium sp. CCBAU 05631]|nr:hypothetical protein SS05631_c22800 [Sinorhizobium sp. CCBAU 05631]
MRSAAKVGRANDRFSLFPAGIRCYIGFVRSRVPAPFEDRSLEARLAQTSALSRF